ncbi:transcription factor MYB97-like [Syzygium oleosum]|uniref:transcription factor MYB97-like n=1 Tax=Syzygium oleosum TaxID=219896 RepID=UPI0024BA2524|nr:transcription factor MYB97-like [Syzygium oleosum]
MNGGGGRGGGGGEGRPRKILKKGMWSPQEDKILTEYVRRHGEGNWNAVHRRTPLLRCGKSCRLRWANHLKPDLKKGAFSPEEASLVVQLHAEHGNKWAHMASLLPGRTDNEIKNFWNTRVKRLQRADYPVYLRRPRRPPITESGPSNPSLADDDSQPHPCCFFGASSSQQLNWPGPCQCPRHQLHVQSTIVELRRNLSAFCAEYQLPSGAAAADVELPSIQTTPLGAMVQGSGGGCSFFATQSKERKSGLLEDLLVEAETLALKEKEKKKNESLGGDGAETAASSSFSVEVEPAKEPIDEVECMDDDLSSLLASFTSTMPSPDW